MSESGGTERGGSVLGVLVVFLVTGAFVAGLLRYIQMSTGGAEAEARAEAERFAAAVVQGWPAAAAAFPRVPGLEEMGAYFGPVGAAEALGANHFTTGSVKRKQSDVEAFVLIESAVGPALLALEMNQTPAPFGRGEWYLGFVNEVGPDHRRLGDISPEIVTRITQALQTRQQPYPFGVGVPAPAG